MTCVCEIMDLVNKGCTCGAIAKERESQGLQEWTVEEIQGVFNKLFKRQPHLRANLEPYNHDLMFVRKHHRPFIHNIAIVCISETEDETTNLLWDGSSSLLGSSSVYNYERLLADGIWIQLVAKNEMF